MTHLKTAVLVFGFALCVRSTASFAEMVPNVDVPQAVSTATVAMAKACGTWPAFVTQKTRSLPQPINDVAMRDRELCDIASKPATPAGGGYGSLLLILAIGFFALTGLYATGEMLWRRGRFWVSRALRRQLV